MKYVIIGTMIFTAIVFGSILITDPIFWAPRLGEPWNMLAGSLVWKRCASARWYSVGVGICDIVVEIMIFIIPVPAVLELQLSLRQKFQVLAVFMTAAV